MNMAKELPDRSEVKVEDTWDLTALFENDEAWESAVKEFLEMVDKICEYEGKLCDSAENLLEGLNLWVKSELIFEKCSSYASKLYDQDTADSKHQAMNAKIWTKNAEFREKIAFLITEIVECDEKTLYGYLDSNSELNVYRLMIDRLRREKPHTLSKEMEQLLAASSDCLTTPYDTFGVLSDADMEFGEITDENGEKVRITQGRYIIVWKKSLPFTSPRVRT